MLSFQSIILTTIDVCGVHTDQTSLLKISFIVNKNIFKCRYKELPYLWGLDQGNARKQIDFLKVLRILQVGLLMLHHLSHPYKKNINYFAYFPITVTLYNQTVSMYLETYNGERYFVFFGAISKCKDVSLAPQSATSSAISLKL